MVIFNNWLVFRFVFYVIFTKGLFSLKRYVFVIKKKKKKNALLVFG